MYSPFADGVTRIKPGSDNFAYVMAAKHYGAKKPLTFVPDESVQSLIVWKDGDDYTAPYTKTVLPAYTYFDDMGIVISRGSQRIPFSISMKAGHNAENHNHMDVGSYVVVLGDDYISGDIGAPSYIAGAFSDHNPARSSWGHPVPRINNTLQSKGKEHKGIITKTRFQKNKDMVTMDIKAAYEIPELKILNRTMINDRNGNGTITVSDEFKTSSPVIFGTAVMVNVDYKVVDEKTIVITSENQKVKAEVSSNGAAFKITDEVVPVKHLRSGKKSYRIGIDFVEPLTSGSITVRYTPIEE